MTEFTSLPGGGRGGWEFDQVATVLLQPHHQHILPCACWNQILSCIPHKVRIISETGRSPVGTKFLQYISLHAFTHCYLSVKKVIHPFNDIAVDLLVCEFLD